MIAGDWPMVEAAREFNKPSAACLIAGSHVHPRVRATRINASAIRSRRRRSALSQSVRATVPISNARMHAHRELYNQLAHRRRGNYHN